VKPCDPVGKVKMGEKDRGNDTHRLDLLIPDKRQ